MMRVTKKTFSDTSTSESLLPVEAVSPWALYNAMPQVGDPLGLPMKRASLLPVNGEIPDQSGVAESSQRKLIQSVLFAASKPAGIMRKLTVAPVATLLPTTGSPGYSKPGDVTVWAPSQATPASQPVPPWLPPSAPSAYSKPS